MYQYETHLHTLPVSRCARVNVREALLWYKSIGYAGVFITNHFLDGNINIDNRLPYEDRVRFYFSDCKEGKRIGREIGLDVFTGVEISYGGTDFLIYGLDEAWYLAHPEIEHMKKSEELAMMAEAGALVIQAHPFREAGYIDHIRLFPRHVHGVETYNAGPRDLGFGNAMAECYAKHYGLLPFAGSDNHQGSAQRMLGGMESPTPIIDEADFAARVKSGEITPFHREIAGA